VAPSGDLASNVTHSSSATIRKITQKTIKCNHQNRLQCLFAFWPNPAGAASYASLLSISSAWKRFSEEPWESMVGGQLRITVEDRRGYSRSVYVADDILKNKNAARNGSFGNDSKCGEGTTVVLMKEIWGCVRRRRSDEAQSERYW
jgi:hypothetical protein